MVRAQIAGRVALDVKGVDCFDYLVEDCHCLFLVQPLGANVTLQTCHIGFCDESNDTSARNILFYLKEMLREQQSLDVPEDVSVEVQSLADAKFIDLADSYHFDKKLLAV